MDKFLSTSRVIHLPFLDNGHELLWNAFNYIARMLTRKPANMPNGMLVK